MQRPSPSPAHLSQRLSLQHLPEIEAVLGGVPLAGALHSIKGQQRLVGRDDGGQILLAVQHLALGVSHQHKHLQPRGGGGQHQLFRTLGNTPPTPHPPNTRLVNCAAQHHASYTVQLEPTSISGKLASLAGEGLPTSSVYVFLPAAAAARRRRCTASA